QCLAIEVGSSALLVRLMRPAHVRAFVPIEPQPAQIADDALCGDSARACGVEVFHPEYERAALRREGAPGEECGPGVSGGERACRRRGVACGGTHGAGKPTSTGTDWQGSTR